MQDTSTDYEELTGSIQSGYYIKSGIANNNEDLFYICLLYTSIINVPDLCSDMRNEFGLDIPFRVCERLLKKLSRGEPEMCIRDRLKPWQESEKPETEP